MSFKRYIRWDNRSRGNTPKQLNTMKVGIPSGYDYFFETFIQVIQFIYLAELLF